MKREIREKRDKLYKESCRLKKASLSVNEFDKSRQLLEEQTKVYKQWDFLKKLSVAMEKVDK